MNESRDETSLLGSKTALLIGVGGLGCPAALALAKAGVGHLVLLDDDVVSESNLPRQILYTERDLGKNKLEVAKHVLERESGVKVTAISSRFLPESAKTYAELADVIVEGADNFATKFLAADAAHLAKRPIVHGAGVRFHGTVWSIAPEGAPCYRCLFEDVLPPESAPNCSEAGVLGPVVGFLGALMADLAIDALLGRTDRSGVLHSFDGAKNSLRRSRIHRRRNCPLCGEAPVISDLVEARYLGPTCGADPRARRSA